MNAKLKMLNRLQHYIPSFDDAMALRRISMALHRWHELKCGDGNGYIERDEKTGKPVYVNCNARYVSANDPRARHVIPDRETGALKRLDKIMAKYPELGAYVQTDPRGAALYIYKKDSLPQWTPIENCYSSIGCAVYK